METHELNQQARARKSDAIVPSLSIQQVGTPTQSPSRLLPRTRAAKATVLEAVLSMNHYKQSLYPPWSSRFKPATGMSVSRFGQQENHYWSMRHDLRI